MHNKAPVNAMDTSFKEEGNSQNAIDSVDVSERDLLISFDHLDVIERKYYAVADQAEEDQLLKVWRCRKLATKEPQR